MITQIVNELGPWNWWILGLILLGLEIMAPGTFFLWFGLSALAVGTISLALGPENSVWVWQVQLLAFMGLSLVSAVVGRHLMNRYRLDTSDNPHLNERGNQMVGRTAIVSDAIREGRGRVTLGDSTWSVSGPDLPKGTRVRVTAVDGSTLTVEAEERQM